MAYTRKISIANLLVNKDNPRFEPQSSQREAINRLLEGNMIDKMVHLAEDIAKKGLNPMERLLVEPSGDDKTFVVLEGNRRVSSIKLVKKPTLADDAIVRHRFERLHKMYGDSIQTEIDCCVMEDGDDSNYWIGLKHGDEQEGVGIVKWTSAQKQRFDEQQGKKKSLARQVMTLLESSSVSDEVKSLLPQISLTSLERLLADKNVRGKLGLTLTNGILYSEYEEAETVRILSAFIVRQDPQHFSVNDIRNSADRTNFMNATDSNDLPQVGKKTVNSWHIDKKDESTNTTTTKVSTPRQKKVQKPKLSSIQNWYNELKKLDEDGQIVEAVLENNRQQILNAQTFVNENDDIDCIHVHQLLEELMPQELWSAIKEIKKGQKPQVLIQVLGGNNQIQPNATTGVQHITKDGNQ